MNIWEFHNFNLDTASSEQCKEIREWFEITEKFPLENFWYKYNEPIKIRDLPYVLLEISPKIQDDSSYPSSFPFIHKLVDDAMRVIISEVKHGKLKTSDNSTDLENDTWGITEFTLEDIVNWLESHRNLPFELPNEVRAYIKQEDIALNDDSKLLVKLLRKRKQTIFEYFYLVVEKIIGENVININIWTAHEAFCIVTGIRTSKKK